MNWEESCERYIAFFDIMGFKNLVYRNSHEFVKKKMDKLHSIVNEVNTTKATKAPQTHNTIKIIIFSDSILFVTKDNSESTLKYLLLTSSWFIAKCFKENIPIKGALSYGKVTANFDKSIFFGKAMIDAYLLQDELQMYGAILDNQIEKKIKTFDLTDIKWLKKLKVPLKGGYILHYTINWLDPVKKFTIEETKDELDKFYLSVSGSVRKYVDNTLEIIDKLKN